MLSRVIDLVVVEVIVMEVVVRKGRELIECDFARGLKLLVNGIEVVGVNLWYGEMVWFSNLPQRALHNAVNMDDIESKELPENDYEGGVPTEHSPWCLQTSQWIISVMKWRCRCVTIMKYTDKNLTCHIETSPTLWRRQRYT